MTDVSPEVLDFLRAQTTLTLATASSNGEPRATALRYANDGVDLYVWMSPDATAAKHLGANGRVSFEIHSEERGLQGAGDAQSVSSDEAAPRFTEKYALAPGGSTDDVSFFRITASSLKLVDENYSGGRGQTQLAGIEYPSNIVLGAE